MVPLPKPGGQSCRHLDQSRVPPATGRTALPLRSHALLEAASAAPGTSPARNRRLKTLSDQESRLGRPLPICEEPAHQPAAGLGSPRGSGTQGPLGPTARSTRSSPSPQWRPGLHPQRPLTPRPQVPRSLSRQAVGQTPQAALALSDFLFLRKDLPITAPPENCYSCMCLGGPRERPSRSFPKPRVTARCLPVPPPTNPQ